tara:strand:- start:1173 stop:1616 length:444 start_codon:yes stop_codon:yes gene_type:complete
MKLFNKSLNTLKNFKPYEFVLVVLLLLYIVSGVSTPYELSPYVNNSFMYLSLFALAILLYLYGNPLLALLFLITSVIFINRSNKVSHYTMKPSQENKNNKMQQLNIPLTKNTLEEEIVGQIVRNPDNIPGPETYHPVLCDSHNATKV